MTKKTLTTYEKFVNSLTPKQRKQFDRERKEFLISEMILAAMEKDNVSVRKLASLAGVSPTIIQGIRTGTKKNVTIKTFSKIFNILGYTMLLEKNGELIHIDASRL